MSVTNWNGRVSLARTGSPITTEEPRSNMVFGRDELTIGRMEWKEFHLTRTTMVFSGLVGKLKKWRLAWLPTWKSGLFSFPPLVNLHDETGRILSAMRMGTPLLLLCLQLLLQHLPTTTGSSTYTCPKTTNNKCPSHYHYQLNIT